MLLRYRKFFAGLLGFGRSMQHQLGHVAGFSRIAQHGVSQRARSWCHYAAVAGTVSQCGKITIWIYGFSS
jgi:hypothetical protein